MQQQMRVFGENSKKVRLRKDFPFINFHHLDTCVIFKCHKSEIATSESDLKWL